MAAKQKGKKDKQSGKQKQQKANLGQKEAAQEKEKQSALSSMGETSAHRARTLLRDGRTRANDIRLRSASSRRSESA